MVKITFMYKMQIHSIYDGVYTHIVLTKISHAIKKHAMQETWAQSLGWEDPVEEGMSTHSRILAWRIPMDRGA